LHSLHGLPVPAATDLNRLAAIWLEDADVIDALGDLVVAAGHSAEAFRRDAQRQRSKAANVAAAWPILCLRYGPGGLSANSAAGPSLQIIRGAFGQTTFYAKLIANAQNKTDQWRTQAYADAAGLMDRSAACREAEAGWVESQFGIGAGANIRAQASLDRTDATYLREQVAENESI
jgi:hypothetical protein